VSLLEVFSHKFVFNSLTILASLVVLSKRFLRFRLTFLRNRAGVISLVQDFLPLDLEHIINAKDMTRKPYVPMPPEDIKAYLQMIFAGLACCHANFVIHRDLKVSCRLAEYRAAAARTRACWQRRKEGRRKENL